jgi:polysaccharide export outer membrane protein
VPELNQHLRVSTNGNISLPLVGEIHIAGMTAEEAQSDLEKRFSDGGFLNNPHVTIYVKEYTTQGISVLGEVTKPGVYPALAPKRLYNLFLEAGGLTQRAGKQVTVTHSGDTQPVTVALSNDPVKSAEANIEVLPGDTVAVSRAGVVYVLGEVNRAGGYVMENNDSMTVSQAVALAAGPTRAASLNRAKVIRRTTGGLREVEVPVKKIMEGKSPDTQLQAEDILFVPTSRGKALMEHSAQSITGMITGLALYR